MTTHDPIQIRAGDLKPAVAGLGKLATRKPAVPALRCAKAETPKRDTLRLTFTDLDLTLAVEVPAKMARKAEPFLVPLDHLRDLTRQTRAGDPLALVPPSSAPEVGDFPDIPAFRSRRIPLPDTAADGLLRAFSCASGDPTRYVLKGAFIDTSGTGPRAHRIVGTDGRHLFSSNSLHLPQVKAPVILPDHKLWKWKPIAESRPWTLRLGAVDNGSAPFRIEGPAWCVTGRTIDGTYPNYRQVIPPAGQFKTRVTASSAAMEAIARLVPRLPGKKLASSPVGLHLEKGRLGLLARETHDEPWILHPIDRVGGRRHDHTVFVHRNYLRKAASFGLGIIDLTDEMSPVKFCHGSDLMVVMPVRGIDPERIERPKLEPAVRSVPASRRSRRPAPGKTADPPTPSRSEGKCSRSAKKKSATRKSDKMPNRKAEEKAKQKAAPRSTPSTAPADPIDEVETSMAEVGEALAAADKRLKSATGSLATARRQRSEDRKELRGLRSLISTIKKAATGSR